MPNENTPEVNPLKEAMHLHLQELSKRPLDATMLLELERTCHLARALFAIGKAPDVLHRHSMFGPGPMPMAAYSNDLMGMPNYQALPAPPNPTETFGVQAIKELVNLLPEVLGNRPPALPAPEPAALNYSELASAMAVARGAGDEKLYEQLMQRLEAEQRRAELVNKKLAEKPGAPELGPPEVPLHPADPALGALDRDCPLCKAKSGHVCANPDGSKYELVAHQVRRDLVEGQAA